MSRAGLTRLVGRARENGELDRELRRAAGGEFRCVLVAAEPGLGKPRLTAERRARTAANELGWIRDLRGDLPAQLEAATLAIAAGDEAGDRVLAMQALGSFAWASIHSGRRHDFESSLRRAAEMARAEGRMYRLTWCLSMLALGLAAAGRLSEANELLTEAQAGNPAYPDTVLLEITRLGRLDRRTFRQHSRQLAAISRFESRSAGRPARLGRATCGRLTGGAGTSAGGTLAPHGSSGPGAVELWAPHGRLGRRSPHRAGRGRGRCGRCGSTSVNAPSRLTWPTCTSSWGSSRSASSSTRGGAGPSFSAQRRCAKRVATESGHESVRSPPYRLRIGLVEKWLGFIPASAPIEA